VVNETLHRLLLYVTTSCSSQKSALLQPGDWWLAIDPASNRVSLTLLYLGVNINFTQVSKAMPPGCEKQRRFISFHGMPRTLAGWLMLQTAPLLKLYDPRQVLGTTVLWSDEVHNFPQRSCTNTWPEPPVRDVVKRSAFVPQAEGVLVWYSTYTGPPAAIHLHWGLSTALTIHNDHIWASPPSIHHQRGHKNLGLAMNSSHQACWGYLHQTWPGKRPPRKIYRPTATLISDVIPLRLD